MEEDKAPCSKAQLHSHLVSITNTTVSYTPSDQIHASGLGHEDEVY